MSRGFTLIETLVAGAIAAIAIGALLAALATGARFAAHQTGPARESATILAQSILRDAQQAWKYGSPGTAPAGTFVATLPNGDLAAVTVNASNASAADAQIDITVRYTPDPVHNDDGAVLLQGQADVRAPLPGSTIARPGFVPMPSNAP